METETLENVARLAEKLPPDEQLILVEKLAQGLRRRARYKRIERETNRQDFYGVWKDVFPQDFDVDAALSEIRGEYQAKFEENP